MTSELAISNERIEDLDWARWITAEQLRQIEGWVHRVKGGSAPIRPDVLEPKDVKGGYGPIIYQVDGEPMVVFMKVSAMNPKYVGWIFCSQRHAKELEEAGVIKFSEANVVNSQQMKRD